MFDSAFWTKLMDMGITATISGVVLLLVFRYMNSLERNRRALDEAREKARSGAEGEFRTSIVRAQEQIVETQRDITATLDNHLGKVSENQAKTAQSLEVITDRLLSMVAAASIRAAERAGSRPRARRRVKSA